MKALIFATLLITPTDTDRFLPEKFDKVKDPALWQKSDNIARAALLVKCVTGQKEFHEFVHSSHTDITVQGEKISNQFMAGFQGLLFYANAFKCLGAFQGKPSATYWYTETLHTLTGLPVYAAQQKEQKHSDQINYYNPQLIKYMRERFILPPQTRIGEHTALVLYQKYFRRFIYITGETAYALLKENKKDFYDTVQEYKDSLEGKIHTEVPLDFVRLRGYFRRTIPISELPAIPGLSKEYQDPDYYYHPGYAAAFWVRRELDGTAGEVRATLLKFVELYDKPFYDRWKAVLQ